MLKYRRQNKDIHPEQSVISKKQVGFKPTHCVLAGAYRAHKTGEGACNAWIIVCTDRNPNKKFHDVGKHSIFRAFMSKTIVLKRLLVYAVLTCFPYKVVTNFRLAAMFGFLISRQLHAPSPASRARYAPGSRQVICQVNDKEAKAYIYTQNSQG